MTRTTPATGRRLLVAKDAPEGAYIALIGALRDVGPADLARLELWPDGSLIEIGHLDIHIAVDGMVKAALPVLVPSRIVAGLFAAAGGAVRSEAKAESSRRNGRKGGRPRKTAAA